MARRPNKLGRLAVAGAVAGAVGLDAARPAQGALVITASSAGVETVNNGTYNVVDFFLTGLTGADTMPKSDGSAPAGLVSIQATFTAANAGSIAVPGDSSPTSDYYFENYIDRTATVPAGYGRSFVNFRNDNNPSRSGTGSGTEDGNGTVTSITGNSNSFGANWFNTNGVALTPSPTTLLAQILVAPGVGLTASANYGTYNPGLSSQTFGYSPTIVSLTAGPTPPTGFGSPLTTSNATFSPPTSTNTLQVNGNANGSYVPAFANVNASSGVATAYVETAFNPTTPTELYALRLEVGGAGQRPTPSQLQTIVTDINNNSVVDGVVASLVSSAPAGSLPSSFGTYDILLSGTLAAASQNVVAFNFANETNVAGVSVTSISAVPEPASLAVLTAGVAGMLARRRRR